MVSMGSLQEIYRTRVEGEHPETVDFVLTFKDGTKTTIRFNRDYPLRYGTNPHQPSAEYSFEESLLTMEEVKTGKSGMSQTNREDILHGCKILKYFSNPTCAVMKHLNPSGVAVEESVEESLKKAEGCDTQAAFGGVYVLNKPVDKDTALATEGHYIEVIGAPDFDEGVMDIFEKRKDLRVIKVSGIGNLPKFVGDKTIPDIKSYEGRLFLETPFLTKIRSIDDLRNRDIEKLPAIVSRREPTEQELKDMLSAWYICAAVRSNGIVFGKNGYSVGIGTGQQDRVTAVRQAIGKNEYLHGYKWYQFFNKLLDRLFDKQRYRDSLTYGLNGAVIASDGLFPFSDSIEACGKVGISAVIQPGGSVKDKEVIEAANKFNMAVVFTGERCFAHH